MITEPKLKQMEKEAIIRLKCFGLSEDVINIFTDGGIPLTNSFGNVETELTSTHKKALEKLKKNVIDPKLPFYITESNHDNNKIVSVLFIGKYDEEWVYERKDARRGNHLIYAYNVDTPDESEIGSGIFSLENEVLCRIE